MTLFADAKREMAFHVLQAHDGRLRAGASLLPAPRPPQASLASAARQLSSATLAATQVDVLRRVLMEQHRLGGSQGLKLFVGESESDESFIKPEDYALPLSSLQLPCGSKNDQIVQVITYSYAPFASILNVPREVAPAPMRPYELLCAPKAVEA